MKKSIQTELKELKNRIISHSNRIHNVENHISDFKDKIQLINHHVVAKDNRSKRTEDNVRYLQDSSKINNL